MEKLRIEMEEKIGVECGLLRGFVDLCADL